MLGLILASCLKYYRLCMATLRRGLVLVLTCKETHWWEWWENHSLFICYFLEVENPMVILTYVYLQFIPSMRGKKFERQSNLDCDMDVNILEKNGRDIGECLSVSETRYLVRSACVQKLECSWRHHKKGLLDKHYLEDQRGYYMGFNDASIRRMCKILI